jgi:hypothetical protein
MQGAFLNPNISNFNIDEPLGLSEIPNLDAFPASAFQLTTMLQKFVVAIDRFNNATSTITM